MFNKDLEELKDKQTVKNNTITEMKNTQKESTVDYMRQVSGNH